jgi:hypothetical protein
MCSRRSARTSPDVNPSSPGSTAFDVGTPKPEHVRAVAPLLDSGPCMRSAPAMCAHRSAAHVADVSRSSSGAHVLDRPCPAGLAEAPRTSMTSNRSCRARTCASGRGVLGRKRPHVARCQPVVAGLDRGLMSARRSPSTTRRQTAPRLRALAALDACRTRTRQQTYPHRHAGTRARPR